ncbi:MAG: hypothetical protein ACI9UA_002637, partial [Pseudoalteromonas tetraodonis]
VDPVHTERKRFGGEGAEQESGAAHFKISHC